MKNSRLYPSFLVAAAVTVLLLTAARADESESATIKFSDPSKPGIVKISIANGDLKIHGADADACVIQTDLKPESKEMRKDGLRVLSSSSSYSLTEKNNVVLLSHGTDSWGGSSSDFNITVPRNTTIIVNSNFGGDINIGGITGNIEVKTLNGEVVLDDIAGAALVETMNGEIKATVRELVEAKPLSFTSMNGEVALNLPANAKANVRLRTHNGSILTDFDDKALVTKTESIRTGHSRNGAPRAVIGSDGSMSPEVREAVREAARAGAQAARQAAEAIKSAAMAARDAERQVARERHSRDNDGDDDAPVAPVPPVAPLPPMTGGKIVTGTLNGGGPEILIATMNGDVTLRKIDTQK
ncbi:MAG: hypothetical protein JWM35_72 [Verrucomicrobia bacterium]|nr:hypothetical protein [Verrucomicrobiota bacterium]